MNSKNSIIKVSYILLVLAGLSLLCLVPFAVVCVSKILNEGLGSLGMHGISHNYHYLASFGIFSFIICFFSSIALYLLSRLHKYKSFSKSQKIHFYTAISAFVLIFILHNFINPDFGDDIIWRKYLDQITLTEIIGFNFFTHQSRIIGTVGGAIFTWLHPIFWCFFDSLFMVIIIEEIIYIFMKDELKKYSFLVYLYVFLIPLRVYYCAGWEITTITYVWPLAFFLPCFMMVKKIFSGAEVCFYEFIVTLVFAAMGATELSLVPVLLVASIVFIMYQVFFRENHFCPINSYLLLLFLVAIFSLLVVIFTPGNWHRAEEELRWFPEYPSLSLFNKLSMGLLTAMSYFFAGSYFNLLIIPFLIVMIYAFIKKRQYLSLSGVIFPLSLVFMSMFNILPWLKNDKILYFSEYSISIVNTEIIIYFVIWLLCLMLIYQAAGKGWYGLLIDLVFLAGFGTKFMVCFSPTVYASDVRTTYYMSISVIMVSTAVFSKGNVQWKQKKN
ncbi:MAG: hypothetical protein K5917_00930 [Clostridiales bacterium]|nr:hypothetical protein [Clostridiales bacterium]